MKANGSLAGVVQALGDQLHWLFEAVSVVAVSGSSRSTTGSRSGLTRRPANSTYGELSRETKRAALHSATSGGASTNLPPIEPKV